MIFTFFEKLVLGHLVGDYLLQNNWMALNKTTKWIPCLIHVLLYTFAVCLFTWTFNPWWVLVVFASHFFVDRWSLADKWGQLIRGRSLKGFINNKQIVVRDDPPGGLWHSYGKIVKDEFCTATDVLQGSFVALVYTVIDNTMHILLMVGGTVLLKFLGVM